MRKVIIGITAVLITLICLGFAGCDSSGNSQKYVIEDQDKIETEAIGTIGECVPYLYQDRSNEEAFFEMMADCDSRFIYALSEEGTPDEYTVYQTNKDEFNELLMKNFMFTWKASEDDDTYDADYLTSVAGESVYNFLNQKGLLKFQDDMSEVDEFMYENTFEGKTPTEYFKERNLSLSCDEVIVDKIGMLAAPTTYEEMGENGEDVEGLAYSFYAICKANVTTKSCDGDSMFPPEGESKDMTIMLCFEKDSPYTNYCDILFQ